MKRILAFALAAAALAITSAPAEAHEYCHSPSYGYRDSYRRVVIVAPTYGWRSAHSYHSRGYRQRYECRSYDRHGYHRHHTHGVRGVFHRVFR